jgi:transcriptional regulator with XRE-family HTH domain
MPSPTALAIRAARHQARITQTHLAALVGLKARAVSRWEKDESTPTLRVRARLVQVLQTLHPPAAAALADSFAARNRKRLPPSPPPAPPPPAAPTGAAALELALFQFADDLDVPPRRARLAFARLLDRLQAGSLTLESARDHLAQRSEEALP